MAKSKPVLPVYLKELEKFIKEQQKTEDKNIYNAPYVYPNLSHKCCCHCCCCHHTHNQNIPFDRWDSNK